MTAWLYVIWLGCGYILRIVIVILMGLVGYEAINHAIIYAYWLTQPSR